MPVAGPPPTTIDQTKLSHIGIQQQPPGVTRETFHVSKGKKEFAEWFCIEDHMHSTGCFTVKFNKQEGCPFEGDTSFPCNKDGYARSSAIKKNVEPGPKIYHYSIELKGSVIDPGGAVDP